jgi:hypothetical protein
MVIHEAIQFYFVFPNGIALNSYSWILPHPQISDN